MAEELGAAMGVSTQSAMALMADALDLRHRLPLLWAKVEALGVAPYKTRRVAADTRSLPFEGARWVDEQLAARVNGFGLPDHRAAGRPGRGPLRARGAGREGAAVPVPAPRDADPPAPR